LIHSRKETLDMAIDRRKFLFGATAATAAAAAAAVTAPAAVAAPDAASQPADLGIPTLPGFTSKFATANGIRLHYVTGGEGPPLVLLHGWPETWWMYRKVMPALAANFTVIAVDLRGAGASDKPATGYDKKNLALDIYELVTSLGYSAVNIVGHDIGAMVAFSFAVNHPAATTKVSLLSVTHPNEGYYQIPMLAPPGTPFSPWWFAFNQLSILPAELVSGRSGFLINSVFDYLLVNPDAVDNASRAIYAANYSYPAAIEGGNGWYQAFNTDIADMNTYGKVTAPMLGLAAGLFYGQMQAELPPQGTNVQVVQIQNAGHYLVEEQPKAVIQQFQAFFG
jgi:pimeloyl-ACP methyl ester carboxylesterase